MLIKVLTYTGDGVNARPIVGAGFQPNLVIVKGNNAQAGMWRTSTMAGDLSFNLSSDGAAVANMIESLDADGFTIGDALNVNESGTTYYALCVRDNGDNDFAVGTYTGDGTDNRDITVGWQPNFVALHGDSAGLDGHFRTSAHTGDTGDEFLRDHVQGSDRIQAFGATTFQLGTLVNTTSVVYHWFAFKSVTSEAAVGTYTGDAADNRSITGAGFQPDWVFTKNSAGIGLWGVIRTKDHSGDSSMRANAANVTNRIQAFEADGFQVGTNDDVNQSTVAFYWLALKEVAVMSSPDQRAWAAAMSQPFRRVVKVTSY